MKSILHFSVVMLVATMMLAIFPTDAEAQIYEDTIRLHILANSDLPKDQELKIEIRDRILEKYGGFLSKNESKHEAESKMMSLLPQIEADAMIWVKELGYDYSVSATLTTEWYETRDYEGFSLPCGYYTSLRVIIGEGKGQNWWCVMYPPLCLEIATESAPADDGLIDYSKEELKLIKSGKYNVKFKILEDLSRVFSKNG
jgi:stage II sporulation protein R